MESKRIESPIDMQAFALAGNATFTLVGATSRFTYKVRKSDDGRLYFVALMNGPDNEGSFAYLGLIRPELGGARYEHGRKSKVHAGAPSARAFAWFWQRLMCGADLSALEFWHEGKCGRCGRKLTVPESIERGIGPECAQIMCEAA